MHHPIRVAITGAAGQIGYSLLFRIAAGEMLRELGHRMWKTPEWVMDVVDENGKRVCRLRFRAEG